jgi:heterodisulfide reductase subunit B
MYVCKNFTLQEKSAVKNAAIPKEVKAKYCTGCGACTPNRKKQKEVEAKNIRPKRKRPLNRTKNRYLRPKRWPKFIVIITNVHG